MVNEEKVFFVACYPCHVVVERLSGIDAEEAMKKHLEVESRHFNRIKNEDGANYAQFKRVSFAGFTTKG